MSHVMPPLGHVMPPPGHVSPYRVTGARWRARLSYTSDDSDADGEQRVAH